MDSNQKQLIELLVQKQPKETTYRLLLTLWGEGVNLSWHQACRIAKEKPEVLLHIETLAKCRFSEPKEFDIVDISYDSQKNNLIDMMREDEESGLYQD